MIKQRKRKTENSRRGLAAQLKQQERTASEVDIKLDRKSEI
jgi:hypothetical protein